MTRNSKIRDLVLMGIMTGMIFLMAFTPIGYIKTGTLSITLITIPVAITAYALGPKGGAVAGLAFGVTSAIMAFMNPSAMMVALTGVSAAKAIVLCIVPRTLDGLIVGLISDLMKKIKVPSAVGGAVSGFAVAFLNTVFFMSSLVLLYGNTEYVQNMRESVAPGKNVVLFILAIVSINVAIEWIASTVVTSGVAAGLTAARLIETPRKEAAAQ